MVKVILKQDTLDYESRRFAQERLPQPLFLNSIPKSGSHLLRNIMRMFVPVEDHYAKQFIQWGNLREHLVAFDADRRYLSWGHLLFSDASAVETAKTRKIILVRDPHTWVLARARFMISDEFGDNSMLVKDRQLSVPALINLMIFGIKNKTLSLQELYTFNGIAWLTQDMTAMVRYEDLVDAVKDLGSDSAEAFFMQLFADCELATVPADWRERVRIGSDRQQSGTARENLTAAEDAVPKVLTDHQKDLIEFAAPGLRKLLGYA
jgi:hypothetical protein